MNADGTKLAGAILIIKEGENIGGDISHNFR